MYFRGMGEKLMTKYMKGNELSTLILVHSSKGENKYPKYETFHFPGYGERVAMETDFMFFGKHMGLLALPNYCLLLIFISISSALYV